MDTGEFLAKLHAEPWVQFEKCEPLWVDTTGKDFAGKGASARADLDDGAGNILDTAGHEARCGGGRGGNGADLIGIPDQF